MTLKEKVLDERNIYSAMYAVPSLLVEKSLLAEHDLKYLNKLNQYGSKNQELLDLVKDKLEKAIDNPDFIFSVSFFFKYKKIKDNKPEYRPIHTCDIQTLVCLIAMTNVLCFDDNYENGTRELSSLSKIIPNHFWGNKLSTNPRYFYQRWSQSYKDYVRHSMMRAKEYRKSKQYTKEIYLDIKEFFPSVNPGYLCKMIKDKLELKYTLSEDRMTLDRILTLLLYFKISAEIPYTKSELFIYYGKRFVGEETDLYTRGLPQGLPHTYFFANLEMIQVDTYIKQVFNGSVDYYVDDSVLFCNCDKNEFERKINRVNKLLRNSIINKEEYSTNSKIKAFQENHIKTGVLLHGTDKSSIIDVSVEDMSSSNLYVLDRNASGISIEVRNSINELGDQSTLSEINALVSAIEKEINRIYEISAGKSSETQMYLKRLKSYYKYYSFRRLLLEKKKESSFTEIRDTFYKQYKNISNITFFDENLEFSILQSTYRLLLSSFPKGEKKIIKIVSNIDNRLSKYKAKNKRVLSEHLYYCKDVECYLKTIDSSEYNKINHELENEFQKIQKNSNITRYSEIEGIEHLTNIEYYSQNKDYRYFIFCTDTSLQRDVILYNLYIFLNIPIDNAHSYFRAGYKALVWYQLRLLHYLRLPNFSIADYNHFVSQLLKEVKEGKHTHSVDYSIFQVLSIFANYVKDPILNDNLIKGHQYVFDMWKNGSKFLHFFTLHNVEHSIELIRMSLKMMIACSYFKLTSKECYLLFMSCYLHDISLVFYPNIYTYTTKNREGMVAEGLDEQVIIRHYKCVDSYFEGLIRNSHQMDSARFILNNKSLNFLDDNSREDIAKISRAHGESLDKVFVPRGTDDRSLDKDGELIHITKLRILLCLVDCLDMREDRVSPAYLESAYDRMPDISKFHWISHLAIADCEPSSEYNSFKYDSTNSYLEPKNIQESIKIKIDLNTNIDLALPYKPHKYGCNNTIVNKIDQQLTIEFGEKRCSGVMGCCPFICKWMVEKNTYLILEFNKLQIFLEDDDNYNTKIMIEYNYHNHKTVDRYISDIQTRLEGISSD